MFATPNILWLLLVFPPALAAFFWWSWRKHQTLRAQFIQNRLLAGLIAGLSPLRWKIRAAILVAAVVFLILALARPQWGSTWQEVKQRGVDIVVAIDTSKSMLATDIAPSRLARAKLAALDLMQQAKSDRLGLVAFAGNAFLQCPLTIDDAAFRQSVDSLDVNTIPEGGTAIAEAIETAMTAFKEGDNHKVLVLMTDGEDHDSGALEAAQRAAQAGLRIFTIGIGTDDGAMVSIKDNQGNSDYVRDEQGNVVKSHLNSRLLMEIAGASEGGFYLHLTGAKTIDALYAEGLAKLPKSEHQEKLVKLYHERFQWPLMVAILLLAAEMVFPERSRRGAPERKSEGRSSSVGKGGTTEDRNPKSERIPKAEIRTVAVAILLLPLVAVSAFGSPASALREYKSGQYDQAQKDFEALAQKNSADPRLHFDAGAAAYRNHQFAAATNQFNQAVGSPDLKLQQSAYYNRGNSLYYLGEQAPDPNQRSAAWEQSLKDFDLAMKLNPQDADAKYNHEFVKQRLEELKQQQQQQQQQKQDKNDQQKQDQNQQQQNQQNDQSKQDQQKQQDNQSKPDQNQQQQQQQDQQSAQQKQQDQQQQQAAQQKQDQQQQQQQQAAQAQESKEKSDEQNQASAAETIGQMTPEQARQLLDAQKGDEQMLTLKPENKPQDRTHPIRDW